MNPNATSACELKSATPEDEGFLRQLYANTRQREEPLCRWPKTHRDKFLAMQYEAQKSSYVTMYPDAHYYIVVLGEKPIGRLILNRRNGDVRVVDISILESHRGRGFGGTIMRQVLAEAGSQGGQVSLHVLRDNPALHLYQRLGFLEHPSNSPGRIFLVWTKPQAADANG